MKKIIKKKLQKLFYRCCYKVVWDAPHIKSHFDTPKILVHKFSLKPIRWRIGVFCVLVSPFMCLAGAVAIPIMFFKEMISSESETSFSYRVEKEMGVKPSDKEAHNLI